MGMKGFARLLFNFFWFLIVGISSVVTNAVLGAVCCITIIGIPFGLQYFKFIRLVFAPAGKKVVTKYSKHPVMNTLWLIFGGFPSALLYFLIAILFCITIIGAPIGIQLMKISSFCIAPFGCEIIRDGDYTASRNTPYDLRLIMLRVASNPDKVVYTTPSGEEVLAKHVVQGKQAPILEAYLKKKKYARLSEQKYGTCAGLAIVISLLYSMNSSKPMPTIPFTLLVIMPCFIAILAIVYAIEQVLWRKDWQAALLDAFTPLFDLYPYGTPTDSRIQNSGDENLLTRLGVLSMEEMQNENNKKWNSGNNNSFSR